MNRVILALTMSAAAFLWPGAAASAAPKTIASFCSPTGDYCQALVREDGRVKARISTFSFRGRIQLCVNPPRGSRDCKRFRLRSKDAGIYESAVTLSRHFNLKKRGRYSVGWGLSGTRIGKKLHFKKG